MSRGQDLRAQVFDLLLFSRYPTYNIRYTIQLLFIYHTYEGVNRQVKSEGVCTEK